MNPCRWTAAVAMALVISACDDLAVEPYAYGEVRVEARLRSGAPAPGVELVLYTGTRHLGYETTGPDGAARFRFVPEGALGVSVRPGVYRPEDQDASFREFELREGGHHTVRFVLLAPGAIRVRVQGDDGDALTGVPVQVYTGSGTVAEQVAQVPGPLLFQEIGVGEYGVRALETETCRLGTDGFVFTDGHVVREDEITDVTLVLPGC